MKNTAIFLLCFPALRAACLRSDDEMVKAFKEADKFAAEKNKRRPKGECEKDLTGEEGWKVTYHPAKDGKDAMWVLSFGHRGELVWSKTSGKWTLDYLELALRGGELARGGLELVIDLLKALKEKKPKCLHLPPDIETLLKEYNKAKAEEAMEAKRLIDAFSEADEFANENEGRKNSCEKSVGGGTGKVTYHPAKDGKDAMWVFSFGPGRHQKLQWSKTSAGEWYLDYNLMNSDGLQLAINLLKALKEKKPKCLHLPPDKETLGMEYYGLTLYKPFFEADAFAKKTEGRNVIKQKPPAGTEYYPAKDGKDAMLVLSHDDVELKWSKEKKSREWKLFDYEKVENKEEVIELLEILRIRQVEAKHLPLHFEPNDKVADEMAKDYLKVDDSVAQILLEVKASDYRIPAGSKFTPKELTRGVVDYYSQPHWVYLSLSFYPYGDLIWTRSKTSPIWEFKIDQTNQIDEMSARKLVSALRPRVTIAKHLRLPNLDVPSSE